MVKKGTDKVRRNTAQQTFPWWCDGSKIESIGVVEKALCSRGLTCFPLRNYVGTRGVGTKPYTMFRHGGRGLELIVRYLRQDTRFEPENNFLHA